MWISVLLTPAFRLRSAALVLALGLLSSPAPAAEHPSLRSPDGGEVRALIIGIDAYRHVRPLRGAAADARDLEGALRNSGAQDVTALIDDQVNRAAVMSAVGALIARTGPRDLVILTLAGHGAQEPERVPGSHPDGLEDVFLLPGFEATPAGSQERIFGSEFNHLIKQIERRGARVMFVADTCYGGGMAREVDPRSAEMSFRQVPSYRLSVDLLKPIATNSDEMLTELDFEHTAFLAAVDRKTKSPEVKIPGIPGLRGALSYAVARAIEGGADADGDGRTTLKELFTNVRQVVYQLSDQRQNIVTTTPPSLDLGTNVVFEFARAVKVIESANISSPPAPPALPALPAEIDRPIKIASLDGKSTQFANLASREAAFEVVRPADNPDLIWDPASQDVVAWGDVIAYRVELRDLPSIIDRAAAIRELKRMAVKVPQSLKVIPNDALHRKDSVVQLEVSELAGRALLLFNIASDGTVQLLYPIASDSAVVQDPEFRFPVRVRPPFGSDQLIAVTSQQRMPALEQALQQLNRKRSAIQMVKMLQRYAPGDARIGSAGVFTAP
jgi:Caspase domain